MSWFFDNFSIGWAALHHNDENVAPNHRKWSLFAARRGKARLQTVKEESYGPVFPLANLYQSVDQKAFPRLWIPNPPLVQFGDNDYRIMKLWGVPEGRLQPVRDANNPYGIRFPKGWIHLGVPGVDIDNEQKLLFPGFLGIVCQARGGDLSTLVFRADGGNLDPTSQTHSFWRVWLPSGETPALAWRWDRFEPSEWGRGAITDVKQATRKIALMPQREGGPCDVGKIANDVHFITSTDEGEDIGPVHTSTRQIFIRPDESGDAPMKDSGNYIECDAGPLLVQTYWRFDPAEGHVWAKGVGPGIWKDQSTSFIAYIDPPDPPPIPDPPRIPPPGGDDFFPLPPQVEPGGGFGGFPLPQPPLPFPPKLFPPPQPGGPEDTDRNFLPPQGPILPFPPKKNPEDFERDGKDIERRLLPEPEPEKDGLEGLIGPIPPSINVDQTGKANKTYAGFREENCPRPLASFLGEIGSMGFVYRASSFFRDEDATLDLRNAKGPFHPEVAKRIQELWALLPVLMREDVIIDPDTITEDDECARYSPGVANGIHITYPGNIGLDDILYRPVPTAKEVSKLYNQIALGHGSANKSGKQTDGWTFKDDTTTQSYKFYRHLSETSKKLAVEMQGGALAGTGGLTINSDYMWVYNATGSTITAGTVVHSTGGGLAAADATRVEVPNIEPATLSTQVPIGVTAEDIAASAVGRIVTRGLVSVGTLNGAAAGAEFGFDSSGVPTGKTFIGEPLGVIVSTGSPKWLLLKQINRSQRTARKTGNFTAEYSYVYAVDTSGGAITITLPAIVDTKDGFRLEIYDMGGAAANNITINAAGANTIRGGASLVISTNYESVILTAHINGVTGTWLVVKG